MNLIFFSHFQALAQCEAAEVCHGDLKMQNILVSSSNWVQITDFASFKPASITSVCYMHSFIISVLAIHLISGTLTFENLLKTVN